METDSLVQYFQQYFPLNKQEIEVLKGKFNARNIRRKQFILQQDEVCKHYTFVVSGCFKMYVVDNKGFSHNLQFAAENDWITDLGSFYAEKPGKMFIEAMEPSVVLQIKKEDLLHLFVCHHKFDRNFRIITEQKYIEQQERILQNISTTAIDRYISFTEKYAHLLSRLPNTQIASYLGITPEFLSKVRKALSRRK